MSDLWIIEPRDPLIVRDGRPFGPNPGARAKTLPFPFPSTVAGGVRTRAGEGENGRFETDKIDEVKKISVKGPLLVDCDNNEKNPFLVPAPKDMLMFKPEGADEETVNLVPLLPVTEPQLESNLPEPLEYPVGLETIDLAKPAKNVPAFWYWQQFEQWLLQPQNQDQVKKSMFGVGSLPIDRRTHVAIESESLTGLEGDLFATSGLEFGSMAGSLTDVKRYGLAVEVTKPSHLSIGEGIAPLGGERRLMQWRSSSLSLPELPQELLDQIVKDGACRVILLTPGYFEKGWLPTKLLVATNGAKPLLKAAAVGKPETVSGWDFEKQRPKPTHRLAPAGSVYFIKFDAGSTGIADWLNNIWMQTNCDDDELNRAGFGLTAVGCWDGNPRTVSVKEADNA